MVIPVHNESECITNVVSDVLSAFQRCKVHPAEIVVVDDGSTDDTPSILSRLIEKDSRVRVITHLTNKGIGAANRTGFAVAKGEWVAWMPGDGQFNPEEVLNLYLQNPSADMIVTSINSLERLQADSLFRLFISKGLRLLIRLITGSSNTMTGIFLFKKKVFQENVSDMNTGLFNIFFPIMVGRQGWHIVYSKSTVYPRRSGHSKVINVGTILKTFFELLQFRFRKQITKL